MSAHFLCATAHSARAGALPIAAAVAMALLVPTAHGQAGKGALLSAQKEIEALLAHDHPPLRGEAALVLATTRDPRYYPRILEIAADPARAARLRGIVALGYLGTPGAESFLGDILLRPSRPDDLRPAAALALGLLPDRQPVPAIDGFLRSVDGGSLRKHHDSLAALLAGLMQEPHPSRAPSLLALLGDDANKEPAVHRLALLALATQPANLAQADLAGWLGSRHEEARMGVLEALQRAGAEVPADLLPTIERLAARDDSARVRAAALSLLTGQRQLCSLELGVRAMRSSDPGEVAAGVRAAVKLGGGAIRAAVERHILDTNHPELQAVMLEEYGASSSSEFVDGCLRLASDRRTQEPVRVQAAALAARSGERKSRAMLRRLFTEAEEPGNLHALARAMQEVDPSLVALDRIFPPATSTDLRLLPLRMAALFATGHPGAGPLLQQALASADIGPATKAELLRALRRALAPPLGDDALAHLPGALREVLQ